MSFIVESSGLSSFKPAPAGVHLARLYRIIDLGTQESEFEGKKNYLRKIKFVWELHGEDESGQPLLTDKGLPMIVTKDYTLSWGEKSNLRKDLEAWRNKQFTPEEQRRFDLKNVLDKWCMVNLTHKPRKSGDGVYVNVIGVTPVPAIIKSSIPQGVNKCDCFMIGEPDMELFATFSPYLQETIRKSPEFQAYEERQAKPPAKAGSGFDDMEDSIPF